MTVTTMPRLVQSSTGTLSYPTPCRETMRSLCAAAIAASGNGASRIVTASASPIAATIATALVSRSTSTTMSSRASSCAMASSAMG